MLNYTIRLQWANSRLGNYKINNLLSLTKLGKKEGGKRILKEMYGPYVNLSLLKY